MSLYSFTSSPNWEAFKEIARWGVLFIASWIITATLLQATVVPEIYTVNLYGLIYDIPLRTAFVFSLTLVGRYIDKFKFEKDKQSTEPWLDAKPPKGLLPF